MRNISSRRPLLASVSLTLAVAAGCSSSGHHASPPTTSGSSPPTTSASASPGDADILAAYGGHWADFESASRVFPVDPNNPRLVQHMAGTQLKQVRNQLSLMRSQGQYIQGPSVDLTRARVAGVEAGEAPTATVADCELDPSYLVNGLTGRTISRPSGVRNLLHATLQQVDGRWKVTSLKVLSTGCQSA